MELFRIYSKLDSTNQEAARLLKKETNLHGVALLALEQSAGRGQQGRVWHSEPGNHMALSIILQPDHMPVSLLPEISMKTCLAIIRVLRKMDLKNIRIKWPNDIYAGDKKLAGILIENALTGGFVQHCIIGIGLNVNEKNFPSSLSTVISLHQMTGKKYQLIDLAKDIQAEVMDLIESQYDWKAEYDQLIYKMGERIAFAIGEKIFHANIMGVDERGRLLLESDDGNQKAYFTHEIKWLK
jgi:BirA family biotin operon repressor/biotin-[acetyl-CoA-carboxylase] ligase